MLSNRLTFSNIAATTAVVVTVVGGGSAAYAAGLAKNSVGSPQIINGAVKTADLGGNAVTGGKVKNGSLAATDLNAAAQSKFTAGAAAFHDQLTFHNLSSEDPDHNILEMVVPSGNYLVTAAGTFQNNMNAIETRDYSCELTQPIGDFTNTIATSEARLDGGYKGAFAMTGVALSTAGPMTITMSCTGAGGEAWTGKVLEPRLVAVRVGSEASK